jgi:hypothetical protein
MPPAGQAQAASVTLADGAGPSARGRIAAAVAAAARGVGAIAAPGAPWGAQRQMARAASEDRDEAICRA